MREAEEEIGINASNVEIIGELTTLPISVSSFNVYPFVGIAYHKPEFIPDPKEVEYLIETNVNQLLNPGILHLKAMQYEGKYIDVPYFDLYGNHIWGATAMILGEFLEILRNSGF